MRNFRNILFYLLTFASLNCLAQGKTVKISNGKINVSVNIETGGRVVEYSLNGNNALYVRKDANSQQANLDGGRFDFGPEQLVPPRPETWRGSWELMEKTPNSIKIKSQVAKEAGVQLVREFTLDPNSSHLKVTQTIINVTDSLIRYSHWSRTFGEPKGICLAPLNPKSRFPKGYIIYDPKGRLNYRPEENENEHVRDGVLEILGPPERPKVVTDASEGWLAYITLDNQLFIKKFDIFPTKIYGEMTAATVSVWYNQDGICEIEPLGPWEWIKPGKSTSFTENWYLMDYNYPENKEPNLNEIRAIIEKL